MKRGYQTLCREIVVSVILLWSVTCMQPVLADDKPPAPDDPVMGEPVSVEQVAGESTTSEASLKEADAIKAMIARKAAVRAGRAKAQSCTRCHGRDGIHHLAIRAGWQGSDGQYAMVQLQAFRDGRVSHEVMSAVASVLADEDIAQIGTWLDSLADKR